MDTPAEKIMACLSGTKLVKCDNCAGAKILNPDGDVIGRCLCADADLVQLNFEMMTLDICGCISIIPDPALAADQFDLLTRHGLKLNLVTGQYHR